MVKNESSEPEILGRSVVAGVAGTVVMTVFQKLAEMPLTGRPDSYAPAELVEKGLPHPSSGRSPVALEQRDASRAWDHVGRGVRRRGPRRAPRPTRRGGGVRDCLHG